MDPGPGNAATETPPTAKKRRRPALACAQCRRRKIRCDQGTPCNNCIKAGISDCTIPPNHISTLRLQQSQAAAIPPPPSASSVLTPRPTPQSASPNDLNVEGLLLKIEELEKTLASLRREAGDASASQSQDAQRLEATPANHFGNQSAWLNKTSLSARVLSRLRVLRDERVGLRQSIMTCQTLLNQINEQLTVNDSDDTIFTFGTQLPDKSIADELVDLYLQTFEGLFRILHVPSFLAEYEVYWQQPSEARKVFVLQMQICLGLGAKAHHDSIHFRRVSSQWLLEAETWLGMSFRKTKQRTLKFEDLQLMALTLIMKADKPGSEKFSWTGAGDLLRAAMFLNLHRDPKNIGDLTFRQSEMHRRLWMTILELNLLFSLQAGQVPLITPQDFDTLPPADLSDEELDQPSETEDRAGTQKITRISAPLALFRSFDLRLQTVRRSNGVGPACTYDEIIRFHKELTKAEGKISQRLEDNTGPGSRSNERSLNIGVQRLLVQTTISYYLLALHLPVLGHSISDPTRHFSRKVATAVASRMAESFVMSPESKLHPETVGTQSPEEFFILNRLFTNSLGLLRNLAMQAVFYLALEYLTMKEDQAGDIGAFLLRDEMELLQLLSRVQAWLTSRVRMGMKDVYSCCFVSAAISYAQALTSPNISPDQTDNVIAERALEQSEECRKDLEVLAQSLGASRSDQMPVPDSRVGFNHQYFGAGEAAMDWMVDMTLGGMGVPGYYDWSLQGGNGNMPHYFL